MGEKPLCLCLQYRREGQPSSERDPRSALSACVLAACVGFPSSLRSLSEVHSGVKFAFDRRWPHAPHVALSLSHHLAGPEPALRGAGAGGLSKLNSLY